MKKLIALLLIMCAPAFADSVVEVGPAFLSSQLSDSPVLLVSEQFGGELDNKYSVGFGWIHKQVVTDNDLDTYHIEENIFINAQRRYCAIERKRVCLGLGFAYFNNTNRALGSKFNASVSIEIIPQNRWSLTLRHFSNMGSRAPNMGQDALMVGYTFQ